MTATAPGSTLDQLTDDYWAAWLARHPVQATALGERGHDARLDDLSPQAIEAWRSQLNAFEQRLEAADAPGDGDEITKSALREAMLTDRAFLDADLRSFNIDPMDGPQVDLLNIPSFHPVRSDAEAAALLERWRAMPAYLDQAIADLRRGLADGRTGVAMLCDRVLEQLDEVQDRATDDWPLASPAVEWPSIREELHAVIDEHIRPAFDRYRTVIADEIAPRARPDGPIVRSRPRGELGGDHRAVAVEGRPDVLVDDGVQLLTDGRPLDSGAGEGPVVGGAILHLVQLLEHPVAQHRNAGSPVRQAATQVGDGLVEVCGHRAPAFEQRRRLRVRPNRGERGNVEQVDLWPIHRVDVERAQIGVQERAIGEHRFTQRRFRDLVAVARCVCCLEALFEGVQLAPPRLDGLRRQVIQSSVVASFSEGRGLHRMPGKPGGPVVVSELVEGRTGGCLLYTS